MNFHVLTLFPEMINQGVNTSIPVVPLRTVSLA